MKIAMTASTLPSDSRSGAAYQAHYLANALCMAGQSVTMFSMSPRPEDARYEHRRLPRRERGTIWGYAASLRSLDLKGFDVLHCHGDDCFLLGRRKPRHVRTLHGASLKEMLNCEVLRYRLRIGALALGEYLSLAVADCCVANSRKTLRYFPGVRNYIPCGVDLSVFRPGTRKSERPSILFVGGIQGKKRGRLLLETFARQVRAEMPEAELWVVSGERAEGEGIRFFGKVDTGTLVDLYQRAWVFCLPSSYEGFGVPYVEAMACGTPVVATPNDGSREVLAEGKFGALCRDEELGNRLVKLLWSPFERETYTALGLQRAADFSWERVTRMYLAAYAGESLEAYQ